MLPKFFSRFRKPKPGKNQVKKKRRLPQIGKRQKFVIFVIILSAGLFSSEYFFSGYSLAIAFILGFLTDVFLMITLFEDLQENFSVQPFILPFLCSLSFGLFYFLAPSRLITRIVFTSIYAVGLYSIFLSENIFVVASIRTIALLNSARIITFITSLVSFFFLSNIIFSLHINVMPTIFLFAVMSSLMVLHTLWTYTLSKSLQDDIPWVSILTISLTEIAAILWFWPTSPTVMSLFLTSSFYILTGLMHVWLDRRLFKNVIWEYMWVAVVATFILLWFTSWQG
ncbi:MAG: DUF5656 family protein [Candidatus Levyibacteriota bacterium]